MKDSVVEDRGVDTPVGMLGDDGAVVDDADELLLVLLWVLLRESCDIPVAADELEEEEAAFFKAGIGAKGNTGVILSLSVTILTPTAVFILAGMKSVDTPGEGWRIVRVG